MVILSEDKSLSPNNYPQLISNIFNVEYITCGDFHSIYKTYNNEFYVCGFNFYGQLGQDHYVNIRKFTKCYNWPRNIISVKCGNAHSLLLTLEGYIYIYILLDIIMREN